MRAMLFLLSVAIAYGSAYPFDFHIAPITPQMLHALFNDWDDHQELADVAANISMFVPFGFLAGRIAFKARPKLLRLIAFLGAGIIFATALQVMQFWIPERVASLNDVVLNTLGIVSGAALAMLSMVPIRQSATADLNLDLAPLLLAAAWFAYRLFPYVPTLDFQSIKDNLKPLLFDWQVDPGKVLRDAIAWPIIGLIARDALNARHQLSILLFPALLAADFCIEILILRNGLTFSDAVAAVAATAIWYGWVMWSRRPEGILAAAMATTIIMLALSPFEWRAEPASISLVPFKAYFSGSFLFGLLVLLEKTFLYGSLIWLLQRAGYRLLLATSVTAVLCGMLEFAQIFFSQHSPDLGDPLHALLLGLQFHLLAGGSMVQLPARRQTNAAADRTRPILQEAE